MDFLYDEISNEDLRSLEAHLSECGACQKELESLKKTSHILQKWEDVDPDFNVVMVTEKVSWISRLKESLAQLFPKPKNVAHGLAYVAVGVFLLLAIANTEISYRQGEFKLSMGLLSKPSSQENPENSLTQEFLDQWQKENYFLVNSLIQQSELKQKKETASAILQLRQDLERQRIEDMSLVGYGLDNIERNTYHQIRRTDNSLNELIQLINAQRK